MRPWLVTVAAAAVAWAPGLGVPGLTLRAASADAAKPGPAVDFAAPPACVDADTFRARLAALPESPIKTEPPRAMTIRVTGDGEMFTGELQVEHSDGTTTVRQVASTHCDEVTDALEFVAALALGLDARPPAPPPAPEPEPEREPEPAPVPQRWRLFAAAYGGIASAAGPDVEFAPAVALGVMKDGLDLFAPELELSGTWSMSSHFATKLSPATSQTTLFDAALSVCPLQLGVGRSGAGPALRLRPCAGLQLGALTASTSLAGSTDQVEPWLAAAVLARAEWVFGKHFMLAADGGAAFPILRPDYFFRPSQVSDFHVPAAGGVARLGAAVLWP